MKSIRDFLICFWTAFFSGAVVTANIVDMYGYNENYEGSWLKIAIALIVGIAIVAINWPKSTPQEINK